MRYHGALQREMEFVRDFFSDTLGVKATGFTVLVGMKREAMASSYRLLTGDDLPREYPGWPSWGSYRSSGWTTNTSTGGALVVLVFVGGPSPEVTEETIAREYFRVLQGQAELGFERLPTGETAYRSPSGAAWLVEGMALYADYDYSPTRPNRRAFLNWRYNPSEDLRRQRVMEPNSLGDLAVELEGIEEWRDFASAVRPYALSFLGSHFLVKKTAPDVNYLKFWRLLREQPDWRTAFEEAFDLSLDEFYAAFGEFVVESVDPRVPEYPPMVRFKVRLRWAGPPAESDGVPFFVLEDSELVPVGDSFTSSDPSGIFYVVYSSIHTGSGIISLWWREEDGCTEHLLGYYKDGGLTTKLTEASRVEFTGESEDAVWNIPAHPGNLPRPGVTYNSC